MGETVKFTEPAEEQLADLEKETRKRIVSKLEQIRDWPDHFLKPLKNYPYHRLRVGDYRVIIDWRKDQETLWVVAVGHRRNVYDREL